MILVSETLDCLVFLDIYEMPIFVDNYEMLSFVDIYEMFSFFRYILDVEFIWNIRCLVYLNTYDIFIVWEGDVEILVVEHMLYV